MPHMLIVPCLNDGLDVTRISAAGWEVRCPIRSRADRQQSPSEPALANQHQGPGSSARSSVR